MDDYASKATMMNKTQDFGKFMKRNNLMPNKTMTQMMNKRRGDSDSKQGGAAAGGVFRERTV